jgi:uncharacterized repeat protein (TIGR01451 family)
MTFVSSSHDAVYNSSANTVTCDLGNVTPGISIPIWVNVRIDPLVPDGTNLTDTFSVTWKNATNHTFRPSTASATVMAHSTITQPQLSIIKEGPSEAIVNSTITYTGTLNNLGGGPAFNTTLTDILPEGMTFVNCSNGNATYDPDTHTITWNLGTVPAGASIHVSVTLQVNQSSTEGTVLKDVFRVLWEDQGGTPYAPNIGSAATTVHTHGAAPEPIQVPVGNPLVMLSCMALTGLLAVVLRKALKKTKRG